MQFQLASLTVTANDQQASHHNHEVNSRRKQTVSPRNNETKKWFENRVERDERS